MHAVIKLPLFLSVVFYGTRESFTVIAVRQWTSPIQYLCRPVLIICCFWTLHGSHFVHW